MNNTVRFLLAGAALIVGIFAWWLTRSKSNQNVVVVYVSEDRVFSEPVLKDFEKKTGIKIRVVYDTEETKSTGVMNRLLSEKNNPQADVYWANEPVRAEVLKQKGILQPYVSPNAKDIPSVFKDPDGYWTGFSARARVFVVNKNAKNPPDSVMDYVKPEYKGKGVIANPLFGTTTSEIAALFVMWGDKKAEKFMESMKANNIAVSTSNGESTDFVAAGKYDFALVDSDDAVSRMRQGKPIKMIYPDQKDDQAGCFIVPNTVMIIKGAPHKENAKKLTDYLLSGETESKLAFADCAQIPLHSGVKMPGELKPIDKIKVMKVKYSEVAKKMLKIQKYLKKWTEH